MTESFGGVKDDVKVGRAREDVVRFPNPLATGSLPDFQTGRLSSQSENLTRKMQMQEEESQQWAGRRQLQAVWQTSSYYSGLLLIISR